MKTDQKISFENTAVAFSYKSNTALQKAYFIFLLVNHPWISSLATGLVKIALKFRLPVEGVIRSTVFEHFCGGESIGKSERAIRRLAEYNVGTILDYSIEGEKSEVGFDNTMAETIRTIEKARNDKRIPFSVFKPTGLASLELLEKVQKKETLTEKEQDAFKRVRHRFDTICARGYEANVPVLIDAEETWIQDPIDNLVYEMMAKYNKEKPIVFNTYQLYRTESLKNLQEAFHRAAMHDYYFGAKLVRGAYMEKERERADALGYPSPIYPTKEATDNAFNKALLFCVENNQRITVMCGSHNEYSNYFLTVMMEKHKIRRDDPSVWFAQLYGMSDNITFNLAREGYRVVKYVPYGPVRSVMPYLFRRAKENTSVSGQSSRELTMIQKELKRRRKT